MSFDQTVDSVFTSPKAPDWVPEGVRLEAERLYEAEISEWRHNDERVDPPPKNPAHFRARLDVLRRLVSDPDMKRVWSQLTAKKRREHRPTQEYLHAACLDGLRQVSRLPSEEPWPEMQDFAIKCFFRMAFFLACDPPKSMTTAQLLQLGQPHSHRAARLREIAGKLHQLEISEEFISHLQNEARMSDECAIKSIQPPLFVVAPFERRSAGDQTLRGYLACLSGLSQKIFGDTLYNTIATTGAVAFSTSVTPQQVRDAVTSSQSGLKAVRRQQ